MKERFMKFGNKTKTLFGAIALVVLMAVNVQVGMNDGSTTDINLLGLETSVFSPTAVATEYPCSEACNEDLCYTHYMDPCIYTWCQFDGGPGGTWMCLGQIKN